jgi:hypothetical protein
MVWTTQKLLRSAPKMTLLSYYDYDPFEAIKNIKIFACKADFNTKHKSGQYTF